MSEGTLMPAADAVGVSSFDVEHTMVVNTGVFRTSIKLSEFPRISTLRSLFAVVKVDDITAEVRQNSDVGDEDGKLTTMGHIYVAIIPSMKDTDSATGATSLIVSNVPNKQTFPLSSTVQSNSVFHFNLKGYEVDLAQDPRRGAGPVAWVGNSGVTKLGANQLPICTVTWRTKVTCSGPTPLWS